MSAVLEQLTSAEAFQHTTAVEVSAAAALPPGAVPADAVHAAASQTPSDPVLQTLVAAMPGATSVVPLAASALLCTHLSTLIDTLDAAAPVDTLDATAPEPLVEAAPPAAAPPLAEAAAAAAARGGTAATNPHGDPLYAVARQFAEELTFDASFQALSLGPPQRSRFGGDADASGAPSHVGEEDVLHTELLELLGLLQVLSPPTSLCCLLYTSPSPRD